MKSHPAYEALRAVCADLERHDPNAASLHFARGVLACSTQLSAIKQPKPRGPRAYQGKWKEHFPAMATMYAEGHSILEVSLHFGAGVNYVRAALDDQGVPCRPKGNRKGAGHKNFHEVQAKKIASIMEMRSQGMSGEEIGRRLGITRERVRQIVLRAGKQHEFAERPMTTAEKEAVASYVGGKSLVTVAENLGISVPRMRKLVLRQGHTVRPSPRDACKAAERRELAAKVAADYISGLRIDDIRKRYGLPDGNTIYRLLAHVGQSASRKPGAGRIAA